MTIVTDELRVLTWVSHDYQQRTVIWWPFVHTEKLFTRSRHKPRYYHGGNSRKERGILRKTAMWSGDGVEVDWFDRFEEPLLMQDSETDMNFPDSQGAKSSKKSYPTQYREIKPPKLNPVIEKRTTCLPYESSSSTVSSTLILTINSYKGYV